MFNYYHLITANRNMFNVLIIIISLLLLLLLLLNEVKNAKLGESDLHPISQMTPGPQYQPIE